jgi:4-phytase/acid phosphatase
LKLTDSYPCATTIAAANSPFRSFVLSAVVLFSAASSLTAQAPALQLAKTIPLPGVAGKFDHLAIDESGSRLFIAATGNHSVEVIDLKTDKVQQSITGLGKPHGLAFIDNSLYVADGTLGELRRYKGSPLALNGSIKLSDDADDMVYDQAHHLLFVGHGTGDAANATRVAVVNTDNFALVSNLAVSAHPEALEIDPATKRVFVNVADSNEVAVIDTAGKAITAHWKLTKAGDNVPLAYDSQHQLVFVACRTPGTVIVLDAASGKELSSLPAADGADDLFYDPALRRVYVISGSGEVDSYQVDEAKNLHPLEVLHTGAGAKTALFVPAQNLLYVGVPGAGGHAAEIRVYKTVAGEAAHAAAMKSDTEGDSELKFVALVSRHGVRSPTGKTAQLNQYSAQPWPAWSVPPGYLTEHGAHLMQLFGAYDRAQLAAQGLLAPGGCADASQIRIVADSDQRTRETGKALAAGLAPGCEIEVSALPEGTADPLFHSFAAGADKLLATAAISGRIGGNPQGLAEAYKLQLGALDEVLHGCTAGATCAASPQSIFTVSSLLEPGNSDHLVELRSPLNVASTMTENLLLEYTEGMDAANVGWGRVDGEKLRALLQLHIASEDLERRTPYIARAQSSNLLTHLLASMEQARNAQPQAGALTKPADRLLILVGHDTNLSNISGALGLEWLIDGRRNDTPPGGALVFELWKKRGVEDYSVRVYYTAQTLEQMRNATPLSLENPPARVQVFVPGCSQSDGACGWSAFQRTVRGVIDSGDSSAR